MQRCLQRQLPELGQQFRRGHAAAGTVRRGPVYRHAHLDGSPACGYPQWRSHLHVEFDELSGQTPGPERRWSGKLLGGGARFDEGRCGSRRHLGREHAQSHLFPCRVESHRLVQGYERIPPGRAPDGPGSRRHGEVQASTGHGAVLRGRRYVRILGRTGGLVRGAGWGHLDGLERLQRYPLQLRGDGGSPTGRCQQELLYAVLPEGLEAPPICACDQLRWFLLFAGAGVQ